jgi:MYXO-CTERM domain-containing protein
VSTRVGAPIDIPFVLTNLGTADATINDVMFAAGADPDLEIVTKPAAGAIVAVNGTASVVVRYHATTAHRGALGSLVVKVQNEADREVALSGDALTTTVKSEPPELDFGPICIGRNATKTVDLYAEADGAFVVSAFAQQDAPFTTQSALALPQTAQPLRRSDVRFIVTATPTDLGVVEHALVVTTDAPLQPAYPVTLRVQGLGAGVTATPSALEFPTTIVTGYTAAQTVYFTNCTTQPVAVVDASLVGADLADFAITKIRPSPTPTLEPSQTMELDLQMTPRTSGNKLAELVIDYDGGTQTIELTGSAFAHPKPRDTYYACRTDPSGSPWPVLAVVWLVVRRRRAR